MSPRPSPAVDVRGSMIRAARDQVAACGVAKVSLRAISRAVGVSHQAAAHHFRDRAGLFTALATEGFTDLLADVSAASVAASGPPSDRVAAIGASHVRLADKNPAVFDVMFRPEPIHPDDPAFLVCVVHIDPHSTRQNLQERLLASGK